MGMQNPRGKKHVEPRKVIALPVVPPFVRLSPRIPAAVHLWSHSMDYTKEGLLVVYIYM